MLVAQAPIVPVDHPALRTVLDSIRAWRSWTLQQQIELTEIQAPPFAEQRRAEEFARRLRALGFESVRIDAEGNVIAEHRSAASAGGGEPVVVISGHLDTVFPDGTDVRVRQSGNRYAAPGIGDDGRGLATVLTVARAFRQLQVPTRGTVLFVGTVGEEGEGDLRGVRHLFDGELPERIDAFVSVDGTGFGITHAAVGSNRYRVRFQGPGGHSYGAFGMPNPAHALGRAVAAIADLEVPASPKTTFSVSVLSGGTSVNAIPTEAVFDIDMRSEEPASFRPAGAQRETAPIVQVALAASEALGLESDTSASSTDANLPISRGIPAITIDGGGRGGSSHSPDEWYEETADAFKGPQWAALIVATLAGVM
jgi:acetylornithine deacetylase/succinyl-diaminopimelate desuccinylase-like protein